MGNEGTTKGIRFPAEEEEESLFLPDVVAQREVLDTAQAVRITPTMFPTKTKKGRLPKMIVLTTRTTQRRNEADPDQRTVPR
jgi:hypothetical protein